MSLLDSSGKPFRKKIQHANAVVFMSDDGREWLAKMPHDLPDVIKEPANMAYMMDGQILETTDGKFYRSERVNDSQILSG